MERWRRGFLLSTRRLMLEVRMQTWKARFDLKISPRFSSNQIHRMGWTFYRSSSSTIVSCIVTHTNFFLSRSLGSPVSSDSCPLLVIWHLATLLATSSNTIGVWSSSLNIFSVKSDKFHKVPTRMEIVHNQSLILSDKIPDLIMAWHNPYCCEVMEA